MKYVLGIKVVAHNSLLRDPITMFVENIHDNLEVSFGTDPLAAMTFNNYDHALALSNLLDDANPDLPEFLPMELREETCKNED